ncbi:Cyclin-Y [Echinococcus granulosus]|uniref:Cyclin y n=1 Tax=Echinococcus granulosus TaxID=6210 RepID=A0A068WT64_ECHGR|nr:Cyclin-Y [Echinococcus granulosus]CDS21687.1 cyclin y [Echinococcus granulosus]
MGNRLICCRLSWTSFTNSEFDLFPDTACQSHFQFTNHGAFYSPAPTLAQPQVVLCDDSYQRFLSYCPKTRPSALDTSVQHISEREPEDVDFNPSLNPSNTTLFLHSTLRSITQSSPLKKMLRLEDRDKVKHLKKGLQRWSSCGSVYIGECCLSKPDSKLILHCISVAVCSLIKSERTRGQKDFENLYSGDCDPLIECYSDQSPSLTSTYDLENECSTGHELYKEVYEIYDERVHPLFPLSSYCQVDSHFSLGEPPYIVLRFQHQILYFLNRLFSSSLLTAESAIVALVYLERLISSLEMCVVAWSWRRQLLACILIASKVLDDQAVWNADYCQLLKDVHVNDLNDLERHTLSLLQFNTGVPPAVYARYYFDLLSLGEAVALPATNVGERRRMTPGLARHLRVLPVSAEARAEHLAAAASAGIAFGGGGILFDLPCSSLADASSDASPQQDHQTGCPSQRLRSRQRPHSASPSLSSTRPRHTSMGTKPKTRHHHHPQAASESEYEQSTSAVSTFASTSSSSSSLTWKSSASASPVSSSSTFSAVSGCFQLPTAVSNAAFDPWTTPTATFRFGTGGSGGGGVTGRGDDVATSSTLFLLQQDSGLY